MRRLFLPVMAMLLGAAGAPPGPCIGAAIVAHGAAGGITPCKVCQGMQLQGNRAIGAPALAGRPQSAALTALSVIAAGKRGNNFLMQRIARTLTPAQRHNIAAYLSSLKAPAS